MSDFAALDIRIGSEGVVQADDRMGGLVARAVAAERATDHLVAAFRALATQSGSMRDRLAVSEATTRALSSEMDLLASRTAKSGTAASASGASFGKLLGPLAGIVTVAAGFSKFIEVNREFDKLNAGLITATGSAEGANGAFQALEEFANQTPNSLRETTDAWVKMVNYGLTPSERALRSYGDTSSALGKNLVDMVEAVADAQTGEFERLKEFGIKSQQQGDKVTFTFRGVSTTVAKESKAIQEYLIKLGENNFSGSMATRMATLDGALSNLGDAWDKFWRELGKSPIGDLIRAGVDTAIAALDELNKAMHSDFATAISVGLRAFGIEARAAYEIVQGLVRGDSQRIDKALQLEEASLRQLHIDEQGAENERAWAEAMREAGIEIEKNTDRLGQYEKAGTSKTPNKAAEEERKRAKAEFKQLEEKLLTEEEAIERSFEKRQKVINRFAKGDKWYAMSGANESQRTDELAKLQEDRNKDLNEVRNYLKAKEVEEAEAYRRRRAIVEASVEDEETRNALLTQLAEKEIEAQAKVDEEKIEARRAAREALFADFLTEEEKVAQSEEKKKQAILASTAITEKERSQLLRQLHEKTNQEMAEIEQRRTESMLKSSADLFSGLAQTSKNLAGEQSASYRALFAVSRAFSVAQATMSIATGAAKAMELGWPAGLVAGLEVAARGAMLMAQITNSNFSGAYDEGGRIPSGKIGIVGERGPELVRGPADVTSRVDTAAFFRNASQASGGRQPIALRVVAAPDQSTAAKFLTSSEGETVLTTWTKRNATTIRRILA